VLGRAEGEKADGDEKGRKGALTAADLAMIA
jgi:hypothetical protein